MFYLRNFDDFWSNFLEIPCRFQAYHIDSLQFLRVFEVRETSYLDLSPKKVTIVSMKDGVELSG